MLKVRVNEHGGGVQSFSKSVKSGVLFEIPEGWEIILQQGHQGIREFKEEVCDVNSIKPSLETLEHHTIS